MSSAENAEARGPARRRRDWTFYWRLTVGLGLLFVLFVVVGIDDIIATLSQMSPRWALSVVFVSLIWLGAGAFNVWLLVRRLAPVPLTTFVGVYMVSWATSVFLPGQLGDATQVLLLRRYDVPPASSGAAYVVDKVISLVWMAVVAGIGVSLFLPAANRLIVALPVALVLGGGATGVFIMRRLRPSKDSLVWRGQRFMIAVLERIASFRGHRIAVIANALMTLAKWLLSTLMYLWAFRAFGAEVGFWAAATIPVISSLVGYIPISVGGAGTMEWTAVTLFAGLAVASPTVVSVYLFLRCTLLACAFTLMVLFRSRSQPQAS